MSSEATTTARGASDRTTRPGDDLRLASVTKRFGAFTAVDQLELTVPAGSFFALLGPSGCGKTTTLRMVAGLEKATEGEVYLGERRITSLRPYKRPVNTVFQSYALFPHLSIAENVAFGPKQQGRRKVDHEVDRMLELVELPGYGKRRPAQLSGGQQQRVALARALINQPQVLLLDEPLGALDLKLRRQMQIELKRIQLEVGITFVHVTHDQEEAMTMADTVAVMDAGVVEQLGDPAELYENPATTFVANFLGQSNLIAGSIVDTADGVHNVDVRGAKLRVPTGRAHVDTGDVWVGVRPEKVYLESPGADAGPKSNVLPGGVVSDVSFTGVSTQYLVRMPWGQELTVFEQNTGAREVFRVDEVVDLQWRAEHTFCLDAAQDAHAGVEGDLSELP
ncbi:MAG TPA: ABC transporter ATP-binding protein [Nocardioidaceae bacterium]|nr:ABC transporter ATP-binding protein [Nocardioidaceae bacterium]